jgi:hypothetical protein
MKMSQCRGKELSTSGFVREADLDFTHSLAFDVQDERFMIVLCASNLTDRGTRCIDIILRVRVGARVRSCRSDSRKSSSQIYTRQILQ